MFRFIAVISFTFLFNVAAGAQQLPDAQFGVIPDSLFQMRQTLQNSDAPYIITNKEVDVAFEEDDSSIVAIIEHHTRLKIFDKTAREASVVSIPYYFDNNMEQISGIKAATYLPSGKRIPLNEKEIKTINLNARYDVKEFTMPGVEDGAVLEYKYTIRRRYIEELPDFYLSHKVPTAVAKITLTYPPYLRYKIFMENYEGTLQHGFTQTDTSSVPKIFTIPQPPAIVTEHWIAYDVPAVDDEPFVPSINNYRGKIKFLMSEFGLPRQPLENNWEVVIARLREKSNPLVQARKNKFAASIGDSIAHASRSKEATQDSIYHFLNSKVNFSGVRSPISEKPDSVVLSGKPVGNAAINQTLLAMLHGAEIEAHPLFVSTRPSENINRSFPSFYQFNAMMVQSEIDGETFIMDASMPFSQPGLIPVEMNNTPGLLLKPNSFEWVELQPEKSIFDIQVEVDAELQSNGSLSGTILAMQEGYPAQIIRQQKADGASDTEIFKRMLFNGLTQLTAKNVRIKNLNEFDQPIEITGEFAIKGYAASFSDGLRFRPMLVGALPENPFENKDRDLPITLDAPEGLDVIYSISLPSDYSVRQGKQNHTLSLPGAEFKESYSIQQDELNYEFHIDINRTHFSTAYFPQLYRLYERWVELSNSAWMIQK